MLAIDSLLVELKCKKRKMFTREFEVQQIKQLNEYEISYCHLFFILFKQQLAIAPIQDNHSIKKNKKIKNKYKEDHSPHNSEIA